ncbi:fibronectin type III domain-containing protein [Halobacteriovorax sp. ZH4_bin.1]|uniref:fibronectin type III domain-containing protein n=1 Tax=unclassified Halobacteriovorax TaxID=2639665 RepID=UPI003716BBE4
MLKVKQFVILMTSIAFLLVTLTSCSAGADEETLKKVNIGNEQLPLGELYIDNITILTPGYYTLGETISISVNFNKAATVISGTPRLELEIGATTVFADYVSGSGTDEFIFEYIVAATDNDGDGISAISPLDVSSATIEDDQANTLTSIFTEKNFPSVFVDTQAPSFTSITLPTDGSYIIDDILNFAVTFDESIVVTGSPRIQLQLDSGNVFLDYKSGSGTNTLNFEYTITSADNDPTDGVLLSSLIELNGGTIKDYAGHHASLAITTGDTSGIKITNDIPHTISFLINSGASATNQTSATLSITASNANEMYITTDASCSSGGSWQTYATSLPWTLSSLNSVNNVYIKFRTATLYESDCLSDDIIHDDIAPTAPTINLNSDATINASDSFSLANADATGSTIKAYEVAISSSPAEADILPGANYTPFMSASYQYTGVTLTEGEQYYLLLKTIDAAGNETITSSTSWYVLAPPNKINNLSLVERTTDSIKIAWTTPDPNGPAITGYQIDYKEGVGSWQTITTSHPLTDFTHTGLTPETEYSYRVYATNGAYNSESSNILISETLPDIPIFQSNYMAVNVGGATSCRLVSLEDGNNFEHNGTPIAGTFNKTDTHSFTCAQFDTIEATGKFFVAGRRSDSNSTSASKNANIVWNPTSWVGKSFLFNHTRQNVSNISVYAYTDSDIEITRNGTVVTSASLVAGTSTTLTVSTYASYELNSTGYILAYMMAGTGTDHVDPKPLLPTATDIIGFPSTTGNITTAASSNSVTIYNSESTTQAATLTAGTTYAHIVSGNRNLYDTQATRIVSDVSIPMIGNSTADSNGYCAAPFVPTALMKNSFGINTNADFVAFTSLSPAIITVTDGSDGSTSTITLTRTINEDNVPYRAYLSTNIASGTVFESPDKFQAWYQPNNNSASGDEDETVLFGW